MSYTEIRTVDESGVTFWNRLGCDQIEVKWTGFERCDYLDRGRYRLMIEDVGHAIIDNLRLIEGGSKIISLCEQSALSFYRKLLRIGVEGSVDAEALVKTFNELGPALDIFFLFTGRECDRRFVYSVFLAYGLNYAREVIIEEVRTTSVDDLEFLASLQNLIGVFHSEAELLHANTQRADLAISHPDLGNISYFDIWFISWHFFRSSAVYDYDENPYPFEVRGRGMTLKATALRSRLMAIEKVETILELPSALMPVSTCIGVPGVGKSTIIDTLSRVDGSNSVYLEGGEFLRRFWDVRSELLTGVEANRALAENESLGDRRYHEWMSERLYEQYYRYRDIASSDVLVKLVRGLRMSGRYGRTYYIESMPYLLLAASLGTFEIQHLLGSTTTYPGTSLGNLEDYLQGSVHVPLSRYSFVYDDEIQWPGTMSVSGSIRYALYNAPIVKEMWDSMLGPAIVIDLPLTECGERIRAIRDPVEMRARMKDLEYWPAWRAVFVTLADAYPHIGVVKAAVTDSSQKKGYRALSKKQVACLALVISSLLRMKMIVTDYRIPPKATKDCLQECLRRLALF